MSGTTDDEMLLDVQALAKTYRLPRERLLQPPPRVEALRGVGFAMRSGASLGVVGESGSGKSTLARLVMALETPTAGSVRLLGRDLHTLPADELRTARRDFQMVFQDPYGSLDPRLRIARIVAEPLQGLGAADAHARVAGALDAVGLRAADAAKYPHEFSGGQRQRIAIARALITRPKLIVADEPVSALDVSVQAQVLNLLADLQETHGVTYLFISHDLAVVDHVCEAVVVMYAGRIVEQGPTARVLRAAAHPYTRALLAAMPEWDDAGAAPPPAAPSVRVADGTTGGCPYAARCPQAQARCVAEAPELRPLEPGHLAACHYA
ncbi:MAG: ATP-binding cassette domain-containing protein [Proteobacteria bacterium]|nr:ATP-binding cassette domain-containing protein [Pseudomonadota bacterium]